MRAWARAADVATSPATAPPLPRLSLTLAPAELVLNVVSLKGEYRVTPVVGVALRAAAGTYSTKEFEGVTLLETGGQLAWYVLGDFGKGLQLALDLRHAWNWTKVELVRGEGTRVRAALLVGAKWSGPRGTTLEAQAGYGVRRSEGISTSSIDKAGYRHTSLEPRIELGLGWSL